MQPKKTISFLVGAGISASFKELSTTSEITKNIFEGILEKSERKIIHHTDQTNYPVSSNWNFRIDGAETNPIERVKFFLNILYKDFVEEYSEKVINYEDMFYILAIIEQLSDRAKHLIALYLESLASRTDSIRNDEINYRKWDLDQLINHSRQYINDIVKYSLSSPYDFKQHKNIEIFIQLIQSSQIELRNIFSLNHDIVLENFLKERGIKFTDGFSEPKNDIRYWVYDTSFNDPLSVNLLKLHGSINWEVFRNKDDQGHKSKFIGIRTKAIEDHLLRRYDGIKLEHLYQDQLLIGTDNKLEDYHRGIFAKLYHEFYRLLMSTDLLLISGYSMNDRGINSRIIDWIYTKPGTKIIIVHPDLKILKSNAKYSMQSLWDFLECENRIITIESKIEDVTLGMIMDRMDN